MKVEADIEREVFPEKLQNNFGDFNSSDLWFTVAFVATGMIAWVRIDILVVPFVIIVWGMLMMRSDAGGRRYYLVVARFRSIWRVRFKKGRSKRRVDKEGDPTVGGRTGRRRGDNKKAGSDIPHAFTSVPSDLKGKSIGVMHVKRSHTDSFIVVSEGSDIGSTPLASMHESYARMSKMVAKLVASQRGYSVGVSYLFRPDPFNTFELEAGLENFLSPAMYEPSGLNMPQKEWTDKQYREVFSAGVWSQLRTEVIPQNGRKVWMAVVITIQRNGILAKAESNRLIDEKYVKRLPINKMVRTVISGLKAAGISDPYALDRRDIHLFGRGSWDTHKLDEYNAHVAADPEAPDRDGFNEHWPREEMIAGNDFSKTDGNVATVLRVTANRKQDWQGYWAEFYTRLPGRFSSFALVGAAVTSSKEIWVLERATALLETISDLVGIQRKTRKMQKRENKLNQRADDISDSEFSQSYNILVTLRPEREEDLEDEVDDLETLGDELGISIKRIELAVHQYPALWSGTLGIGGLL